MVPQDWIVAILVTVSVTVAVYLIGRRLDSGAEDKGGATRKTKAEPARDGAVAKGKSAKRDSGKVKAKGGNAKDVDSTPKQTEKAETDAGSERAKAATKPAETKTPEAAPATSSATATPPKPAPKPV